MRRHRSADVGELLHQLLVDVEPSRGVEEADVISLILRRRQRGAADRNRILIARRRVHRAAHLLSEQPKLLDRRRPLHVGGHEVGITVFFELQVTGELADRGGLSRALQADEHDWHRRSGGKVEAAPRLPHQRHQLLVNDLDDLLGRCERLEDFLAERLAADRLRELLDDLEVDVGLEEREPHFAQRLLDVCARGPSPRREAS